MTDSTIPTREELTAFVLGKLPDEHAARLLERLENNPACFAMLEECSRCDDSFIARLHEAIPGGQFLAEPELKAGLERAVWAIEQGDTARENSVGTVDSLARPPAAPDAVGAAPPAQELPEYQWLNKLGEGGMGVVWQARHLKLDKLVAIKVLPSHLIGDAAAAGRFEREMKAVGKLDHPNILRAMDARHVGGKHYLILEYVEGIDLARLVKTRGARSLPDACEIIRQAALGLAHAHSHGLVHRDVKPSNLLLSKKGEVKVLDLGLARLNAEDPETRQLTGDGQSMGTPDFMAPEQWDDAHAVDAHADLYALGCTLFFLVAGRAPFGDERHASMASKMKGHLLEAPPRLGDCLPDVPPEIEELLASLMVKDRELRLGSAAELARRLGGFLENHKVRAAEALSAGSPAADASALGSTVASAPGGTDMSAPTPANVLDGPGSQWRTTRTACLAAGGAILLLLAAIVFFVHTNDGVIRVEIDDPQIEVAVKGTELVLTQADQGKDIKLSPGEKTLVVERGDFKFETDKLILKKGETVTVSVELLAGKVEVKEGDKVIGQGKLPEIWHGWPADAPQPAIAPFDPAQAEELQRAWADYLNLPVEHTNSIGMKFVLVPPGEFTMGSSAAEIEEALATIGDPHWRECIMSESPRHKMILTQPIYVGVHEVTQSQYVAVMELNPSHFSPMGPGKDAVAGMETANHPVETVSWADAVEFCARLSQKEQLKPFYSRSGETVTMLEGTGYRLPTEAEWEFTCRAGTTTRFCSGDRDDELARVGWFGANSGSHTHAVGELKANPLGLFDMHGNTWEWVQDSWDAIAYYKRLDADYAVNSNIASSAGSQRVIRGGSWGGLASRCRASNRGAGGPGGDGTVGFRVSLAAVGSRVSR